jgi:hypothetical protein
MSLDIIQGTTEALKVPEILMRPPPAADPDQSYSAASMPAL